MGDRLGIPGAVGFCPQPVPAPSFSCLPARPARPPSPSPHPRPAQNPGTPPVPGLLALPPATLPTCSGLPSFPSHTPPTPHATQGPAATAACSAAHPEAPHTLASAPARPTLHSHLPHTHTQPPSQPLLPSTHTLTHATPPSALGPQLPGHVPTPPPTPPPGLGPLQGTQRPQPAPNSTNSSTTSPAQARHCAGPGCTHTQCSCARPGEKLACTPPARAHPRDPLTHPPGRQATLRWAPSPGPRRHTPTSDTRSSPARGCRGCPGAALWPGQTCPVDRNPSCASKPVGGVGLSACLLPACWPVRACVHQSVGEGDPVRWSVPCGTARPPRLPRDPRLPVPGPRSRPVVVPSVADCLLPGLLARRERGWLWVKEWGWERGRDRERPRGPRSPRGPPARPPALRPGLGVWDPVGACVRACVCQLPGLPASCPAVGGQGAAV